MVLHAVRAEAPLEKIDNAAMFKLTGLNLKQIVREGEQPETRVAQLAQRPGTSGCGGIVNFSVSLPVGVINCDAARPPASSSQPSRYR
jgi:hypothetical protein